MAMLGYSETITCPHQDDQKGDFDARNEQFSDSGSIADQQGSDSKRAIPPQDPNNTSVRNPAPDVSKLLPVARNISNRPNLLLPPYHFYKLATDFFDSFTFHGLFNIQVT